MVHWSRKLTTMLSIHEDTYRFSCDFTLQQWVHNSTRCKRAEASNPFSKRLVETKVTFRNRHLLGLSRISRIGAMAPPSKKQNALLLDHFPFTLSNPYLILFVSKQIFWSLRSVPIWTSQPGMKIVPLADYFPSTRKQVTPLATTVHFSGTIRWPFCCRQNDRDKSATVATVFADWHDCADNISTTHGHFLPTPGLESGLDKWCFLDSFWQKKNSAVCGGGTVFYAMMRRQPFNNPSIDFCCFSIDSTFVLTVIFSVSAGSLFLFGFWCLGAYAMPASNNGQRPFTYGHGSAAVEVRWSVRKIVSHRIEIGSDRVRIPYDRVWTSVSGVFMVQLERRAVKPLLIMLSGVFDEIRTLVRFRGL